MIAPFHPPNRVHLPVSALHGNLPKGDHSLTSNWFCLLVDFNELAQHIILCVWLLVLGIITVRFVCDIMYKLCVSVCTHTYLHSCE